jgi:ribosome maturation factor RimP
MVFEIERVREIAERVGASSGLQVVEVEMRGAGNRRTLRIVIDKPETTPNEAEGVTHEDCADLSRELSTILDVEDVVPGGSYVLEVSSPGLDRKLLRPADYERFVGSLVKLKTRTPVDGSSYFEGRLQSFHEGRLTLELGPAKKKPGAGSDASRKREIDLANVERANLVPEI